MKLLAAELRAVEAAVRVHRNGREKNVAAFVAFKLRKWASAVEGNDRDTIADAINFIADMNGKDCFDFEAVAYEGAQRILCRAFTLVLNAHHPIGGYEDDDA